MQLPYLKLWSYQRPQAEQSGAGEAARWIYSGNKAEKKPTKWTGNTLSIASLQIFILKLVVVVFFLTPDFLG